MVKGDNEMNKGFVKSLYYSDCMLQLLWLNFNLFSMLVERAYIERS